MRDLPRRAYLTIKYHGFGEFLFRLVTFPLRVGRLERRVREWIAETHQLRQGRRWYRRHGRPTTVVVPTYGDPRTTVRCVRSLRRTLRRRPARIVVVDDGSPAEHQRAVQRLRGAVVVLSPENAGYAASVNRGLERAGPTDDVVVLNNDVLASRRWLEALQRAAYDEDGIGIVAPKLLYPDGRIQSAGSYRNLGAPEWFDHRYRFKPRRHGPAGVPAPALAVTGACMYVKRAALDAIGPMDGSFPMGYEDVDWCLRTWEAGFSVQYAPVPALVHLEATTRGMEVGERERASQERFWSKWGEWLEGRSVRTADGALRVIYVTEGTGVGGGHRDVFEHLNRLRERGHEAELYSLGGPPEWFDLRAPVRTFESYGDLISALAREDALKVATWWRTAWPVWRSSVRRGVPVYFVQDIETSYYGDHEHVQHQVLATYREEFRFMTISQWNRDRLRELGLDAELIPPGIDHENFRPLDGVEKRDDVVLAIGRGNPLKNLPLTVDAWRCLEPRPELWMFGIEPDVSPDGARYFESPSDGEVNELFNRATVFVQTSTHEGFCLPLLEAMAAGTPVVSTDAHGNRDFCRDGENCLVVEADSKSVAAALRRLLAEPELRRRLSQEGRRTAAEYRWERRMDEVEAFYERVADEAARARAPRPVES